MDRTEVSGRKGACTLTIEPLHAPHNRAPKCVTEMDGAAGGMRKTHSMVFITPLPVTATIRRMRNKPLRTQI